MIEQTDAWDDDQALERARHNGRIGGLTRASRLDPDQRTQAARHAALARWQAERAERAANLMVALLAALATQVPAGLPEALIRRGLDADDLGRLARQAGRLARRLASTRLGPSG